MAHILPYSFGHYVSGIYASYVWTETQISIFVKNILKKRSLVSKSISAT